jgi:hypothetical protein
MIAPQRYKKYLNAPLAEPFIAIQFKNVIFARFI